MPLCEDQNYAAEVGYANNSVYRDTVTSCAAAVGLMLAHDVGCDVNLTVPCDALVDRLTPAQCTSLTETLGCGYTINDISLTDKWCARMCCWRHGPPDWFGQPGLAACISPEGFKVDMYDYQEYEDPVIYHVRADSIDPDTNFPDSMRCERRWRNNVWRNAVPARCAYPDTGADGILLDSLDNHGIGPNRYDWIVTGSGGPIAESMKWAATVAYPEMYWVYVGHGVTEQRNKSVALGEKHVCEVYPTGNVWRDGAAGPESLAVSAGHDSTATRVRLGIGSIDDPYRIEPDRSGGQCTWIPGQFHGLRRITSVLRSEADPGTDLQIGPIMPETIPIARSVVPFGLVGGQTDSSCRWKTVADNSDNYFVLIEVARFDHAACEAACAMDFDSCFGYEYQAYTGRCELWNRKPGITVGAIGYQCYERLPMDANAFTVPVWYNATVHSFIIGYVMSRDFTKMCGYNMDATVKPGVGSIDITVSAYAEDVFDPAGLARYVEEGCMLEGEEYQYVVAMIPIEFQHNFSTMWPWVMARDFYRVTASQNFTAFCAGKLANCSDPDRTEVSLPYTVHNITHNHQMAGDSCIEYSNTTCLLWENITLGSECTHDDNCTTGCNAELADLTGCAEDIGHFCQKTYENRSWRDIVVVGGISVVNGTYWEVIEHGHCTEMRPAENLSHCEEQLTGNTFHPEIDFRCANDTDHEVELQSMPELLTREAEVKRLRYIRDLALETMTEPDEIEALTIEFVPLETAALEELEQWRQKTKKECEYIESGNRWVEWNASSERVGATKDTMGYVCPNACSYCPRQNRIDTDIVIINITNVTGQIVDCSGNYERMCLPACNSTANASAPGCLVDDPTIGYIDNLESISITQVGGNQTKCAAFDHTCNEKYVYPLTGEEFCVQGRTAEWSPGGSTCMAVPKHRTAPNGEVHVDTTNECVCQKTTCEFENRNCGLMDDKCNGTIQCGSCPSRMLGDILW
eukprot:SAG31_NODE_398_length_16250_cov_8.737601_1_plen_973_part_10